MDRINNPVNPVNPVKKFLKYNIELMKNFGLFTEPWVRSPYRERDSAACGLIGFINKDRTRVSGSIIKKAISNQHDRGNGLGGGFAAYGIYPAYKELYAFHLMYDHHDDVREAEDILDKKLKIHHQETIPHATTKTITDHPYFKRYFAEPDPAGLRDGLCPDEYIVSVVMEVNTKAKGTFVVSSGKNMGAFKGVGFPEDIADFFQLDQYEGYIWTAHNRFPTNTPGWWGGAHPFTLLDKSIVHNGEISSYGINKRYLESHGYICTLMTDTEVVAYLLDILLRRNNLGHELAFSVLAPPFWKDIDRMDEVNKNKYTLLRSVYAGAALNGPFSFLFAFEDGLIGINDRVKLRPLVVGKKGKTIYMSSEEASIREICPDAEDCYAPHAGDPVIVYLDEAND